MHRLKIHTLLTILILHAFLTACGRSPDMPSIKLKPCRMSSYQAECGKLQVYEDRQSRKGRMIDLNIAVIRSSSPQKAADAVIPLSGGPGVAAKQDPGNLTFFSVISERDLVLVDQRGTGSSNEVYPPQTPDWSGLSPSELELLVDSFLQAGLYALLLCFPSKQVENQQL